VGFDLETAKNSVDADRQVVLAVKQKKEDKLLAEAKPEGIPCLECHNYSFAKKDIGQHRLGECVLSRSFGYSSDITERRPIKYKKTAGKIGKILSTFLGESALFHDYGVSVDAKNFNGVPEDCPEVSRVKRWVDEYARGGDSRYINVPSEVRVEAR